MRRLLTIVTTLIFALPAVAQKAEIFSQDSFAIRGYDAVAYFTQGKPVKGDPAHSIQWKNTTWLFSSKENATAFAKEPSKFAPQYGGYCAYGCSEGHKAPTDPNAWTIVDGKLYLNYNSKVQEIWNRNQSQRIIQANKNWPTLNDKE